MKKIILSIEGMTCSACSNGLEKYLKKQKGILSATVNLVTATALIEYDEKLLNTAMLDSFVSDAGFESKGEFDNSKFTKSNKNDKKTLVLAIIFAFLFMGFCCLKNMPVFHFFHENPIYFVLISFVISLFYISYGSEIIKSGYKNLLNRMPNMDSLIMIGVLSGFFYSLYNSILIIMAHNADAAPLYFEAQVMVITFVKLGRYIENIGIGYARDAIMGLVKITPDYAFLKKGAEIKKVTIDEVKEGDIVVCYPGEKASVDGKVINGTAYFDEAFITGESRPVLKKADSIVLAGSFNYDGSVEYRAERVGKKSTVSSIVRMVAEAESSKVSFSRFADIVSGYFVKFVMITAVCSYAFYCLMGQGIAFSLNIMISVLLVACPCSLGLAVPLAIIVGSGICSKNGILIKKNSLFEHFAKIDTVIFDKTGTLTVGKLRIKKFKNYSMFTDDYILKKAAAVENLTAHPIKTAFLSYMQSDCRVSDFSEISGCGIMAKVDGVRILLGNARLLKEFNITNHHKNDEDLLSSDGSTVVYIVFGNNLVGMAGIDDCIRDDARNMVNALNKMNLETIMLTGDNENSANIIASELGIKQVMAAASPTDKHSFIKELQSSGKKVLMCGDGINDSPSLMSADIGVSFSSASDIAVNSADVVLLNDSIGSIVHLFKIGSLTTKFIRYNLFFAFFYNCLMIPVALGLFSAYGIMLNPMLASLAMMCSSITVILNTLRLKFYRFNDSQN